MCAIRQRPQHCFAMYPRQPAQYSDACCRSSGWPSGISLRPAAGVDLLQRHLFVLLQVAVLGTGTFGTVLRAVDTSVPAGQSVPADQRRQRKEVAIKLLPRGGVLLCSLVDYNLSRAHCCWPMSGRKCWCAWAEDEILLEGALNMSNSSGCRHCSSGTATLHGGNCNRPPVKLACTYRRQAASRMGHQRRADGKGGSFWGGGGHVGHVAVALPEGPPQGGDHVGHVAVSLPEGPPQKAARNLCGRHLLGQQQQVCSQSSVSQLL